MDEGENCAAPNAERSKQRCNRYLSVLTCSAFMPQTHTPVNDVTNEASFASKRGVRSIEMISRPRRIPLSKSCPPPPNIIRFHSFQSSLLVAQMMKQLRSVCEGCTHIFFRTQYLGSFCASFGRATGSFLITIPFCKMRPC